MSDAREKAVEQLAHAFRIEHHQGRIGNEVEADDAGYRRRAEAMFRRAGLVALDPALVEAVEKADQKFRDESANADPSADAHAIVGNDASGGAVECAHARLDLADAVLAQLRAKP